jgi:hypothetical protein
LSSSFQAEANKKNTKQKNHRDENKTSSSFQAEDNKKNTKQKNHRDENKMQIREGAYLSSTSAFGMKHSLCFVLSMFFQR